MQILAANLVFRKVDSPECEALRRLIGKRSWRFRDFALYKSGNKATELILKELLQWRAMKGRYASVGSLIFRSAQAGFLILNNGIASGCFQPETEQVKI